MKWFLILFLFISCTKEKTTYDVKLYVDRYNGTVYVDFNGRAIETDTNFRLDTVFNTGDTIKLKAVGSYVNNLGTSFNITLTVDEQIVFSNNGHCNLIDCKSLSYIKLVDKAY